MEKVTNLKGKLLEGCVWDELEQVLYFVDIEFRIIYQYNPHTEKLSEIKLHDFVGCIVLEPDGTLIAAVADGLYRVNFRQRTVCKAADGRLPYGYRFNDGKCDSGGRFWVGSMAIRQSDKARGQGKLFCIEKGHVRCVYDGYTIPNGLCWRENEPILYHIDTSARRVDAYGIRDGIFLEQKTTAVDLGEYEGVPDGMCMDREGNLWIAMWGGGRILCCDPIAHRVLDTLPVPDANVSCCAFGGINMDVLYISTARDENGGGGEIYQQKMNTRGVKANRYEK